MSQKLVFRILACIMTVVVAGQIAAPETLRMLETGHVTGEGAGYVTGRVLIAFVVGAFLASGTESWGLSFHGRLNIAALAVGLLTFFVNPVQ